MTSNQPTFFVKAKKHVNIYKNQEYSVTFIPSTNKWYWEVIQVSRTKFGDEADTLRKAQKMAEKYIDEQIKIKGGR